MSSTKPCRFPTHSEKDFCKNLLLEHFGQEVEIVAKVLLSNQPISFSDLKKRCASSLKTKEVQEAVIILLQHNLLTILNQPDRARSNVFLYQLNVDEVLFRNRFPKLIQRTKELFGDEGEILMEDMAINGRVRIDQLVQRLAPVLAHKRKLAQSKNEIVNEENEPLSEEQRTTLEESLRKTFQEMAKKRYVERVHPLDLARNQKEVSNGTLQEKNKSSTPKSKSKPKKSSKSKQTENEKEAETPMETSNVTVQTRKRKRPSKSASNASVNLPVELQLMLAAEEARATNPDYGEQEVESDPEEDTKKRRIRRKRANLPPEKPDLITPNVEISVGLSEENLVWKIGITQFLRDFRHQACIRFTLEHMNQVASKIVEVMLENSSPHEREANEPTSIPMSGMELLEHDALKAVLPKKTKDPFQLVSNYLKVLCQDKVGILVQVTGDSSSGSISAQGIQYLVHMENIMNHLKQETLHDYLDMKFGKESARIVKVLIEKRQLEQKTVGELAMLPSNEIRRRLFELYRHEIVHMQEIPKRNDYAPQNTFYTWSVRLNQVFEKLEAQLHLTIGRLRKRRHLVYHENEDLILRASEEQLTETQDQKKYDQLSRSLDRLDHHICQLDDMLIVLRHL